MKFSLISGLKFDGVFFTYPSRPDTQVLKVCFLSVVNYHLSKIIYINVINNANL